MEAVTKSTISQIVPSEEIEELPIESVSNTSLRFKVTDNCSWNCHFCHKEGGWDSLQTTAWGPKEEDIFGRFFEYGYRETHFTGGEPTLNKNLPAITKGLSDIGFDVKATSILAAKPDHIQRCINAGIKGVNVSIHADFNEVDLLSGFVPEDIATEIANLQIGKTHQNARRQILALTRGLEVLRASDVKVKANTVICSEADLSKALHIYEYAKRIGIGLRFLPDLTPSMRKASHKAIKKFLESIKATPLRVKIAKGSSDITVYFVDSDGYEFGVKLIDHTLLKTMCNDCPTLNEKKCTEKYYGIRLEKTGSVENGIYHVRLCLHKNLPSVVMPVEEFFISPQFKEIRDTSF